MTKQPSSLKTDKANLQVTELEGVYGPYQITLADRVEVQRYRISVLICSITFIIGLLQWVLIGPTWAWLWLIPMTISLGLALKWIHIYLRPLHTTLWIFWSLGCLGLLGMALNVGTENILSNLSSKPGWLFAIGPLFAALTGLGFKEFFCFRRVEAIGLTLLIPIALLSHLTGILEGATVLFLLAFSAFLLLILALRKFGMDAADDIGDKSVFDYLNNQRTANAL